MKSRTCKPARNRITLRLTDDELVRLDAKCKMTGWTRSHALRQGLAQLLATGSKTKP